MKELEVGDKVRITHDFHVDEMHRRLGTVMGYAGPQHFIVVDVPGFPHQAASTKSTKWYFARNELEKVDA